MYSQMYLDYLKSELWKERRLATLERFEFRCIVCGENNRLEVHHLNYERLGDEDTKDLVILCKSHHWMADKERQDPGFIERTLANIEPIKKSKPHYCCNVKRWHIKSKKIFSKLETKGYLTADDKRKLQELEDKFQEHITRCPQCRSES
jgi:hypothetical protein